MSPRRRSELYRLGVGVGALATFLAAFGRLASERAD